MRRYSFLLPVLIFLALVSTAKAQEVKHRLIPVDSEEITPSPGENYVWVKGHWESVEGQYEWIDGFWTEKKEGYAWIDGKWSRNTRSGWWVWTDGYWRKDEANIEISSESSDLLLSATEPAKKKIYIKTSEDK